jgi:branched-chain amino acid transport system substrate-binding protein
MRPILNLIASTCCLLLAGGATAHALTVGVAAPLSGPDEPLGRQVEQGAGIAAQALGVDIRTADDACTAAGGAAAARGFVDAKVDVVVGFLCTEAIEAALPILKDAAIPVITIGVRSESLTDRRARTGWPVWRLGPRGDDERNAAASLLTKLWRDAPFAIVDDGTIYGRELAETVRNAAEQAALKPVFIDTYRPDSDNQIGLVGRLKRAGATQVFVGGEGDDVAIMGRDAARLEADIVFAGGEALRAAPGDVPYAGGTLMIAMPEWADVADQKTLDRFTAAKIIPEGYALPAHAAIEVAASAAASAARDGKPLAGELSGQDFTTAMGRVRFDQKGDLTRNPYRIFRFDGGRFMPLPAEGQ